MKTKKKEKILVAMSGGVDSSVAAALLARAGYDVTGAFMITEIQIDFNGILTDYKNRLHGKATTLGGAKSCWTDDYRDAVRVAAKLGIPLLKLDFTKEYKELVLDYMFREYEAGRTPNPDVLCNKFIKFGAWLERARALGFDKIATGHYAHLKTEIPNPKSKIQNKFQNPNYKLVQSEDEDKDQTYFLHQLTQNQLKYVLFPIGDYTKKKVRAMAKKWGLPTAEKEESMGICFVGEVPMKEFLETKIKINIGDIVMSDGKVVGKHQGVAFYTIGQRIGLKIRNWKLKIKDKHSMEPIFVVDKDIDKNILIVGFGDDTLLHKKEIRVADVNWVGGGQAPKFPLQCEVRLRHRQPLQKCVVDTVVETPSQGVSTEDVRLKVKFVHPQRAVTPGQFAVFYKQSACLGGGVIKM